MTDYRIDTSGSDKRLVSEILGEAFIDDPVMRWLQPDTSKYAALYRALLTAGHGSRGRMDVCFDGDRAVGAAVWDPPGFRLSGGRQLLAVPRFIAALGGRYRRGQLIEEMFAEYRPREPHWYLAFVGATLHGRGVGSTLLRAGIESVTGASYLESSNEANIPLYERFGFVVTAEVRLPDGGPSVWPMYRAAAGG